MDAALGMFSAISFAGSFSQPRAIAGLDRRPIHVPSQYAPEFR